MNKLYFTKVFATLISVVILNMFCSTTNAQQKLINYVWSSGSTVSGTNSYLVEPTSQTTYTVVGIDVNGCSSSAARTVNVSTGLAANVTTTPVVCYGQSNGSVTSSPAGGISPYSYAWTGGATAASVTGLPARNYTVTVTDNEGFTITASKTITQPPVILLNVTQIVLGCIGSNINEAVAAPTGGTGSSYIYLWSNGNTTNTITGLSPGTYTVTVTDANSCIASASVIVIDDENCCGDPNNTTINSQSLFDAYIQTTGSYNLNPILSGGGLNYTFATPGTYTLDGVHLLIAQGISITIPDQVTVNITNESSFQSCGNMWAWFVVESGGTLNIYQGSGSVKIVFHDAQYAVKVLPGGNLNCDFADFEHCYDGIYIPDDLAGGTIMISGTAFRCTNCATTNPLKPGYPTQTPAPGNVTFAGVEANKSTFDIGVNGADPNHFTDLLYGARLTDCTNNVLNSDFFNMVYDPNFEDLTGVAIWAHMPDGGTLRQYGYGSGAAVPLSFYNCKLGIYATGGSVAIYQNNMDAMHTGVWCSSVAAQSINIEDNNINADREGIAMTDNDYAGNVDIKNNILTVNGSGSVGIGVWESLNASSNRRFYIDCNNVTVAEGDYGILVNAANNIQIDANGVNLTSSTTSSVGIGLQGAKYCTLLENTSSGNSTNRHTAFLTSVAAFTGLTNNHADNTAIGFDFLDGCDYTDFKGNTMGDHNVGLHLNNSGVMGTQTHAGNTWNGTYSSAYGAENYNSTSAGVSASQFIVHVATPGPYRPNYDAPNESPFDPWFKFDPSGLPSPVTFPNICIGYIAAEDDDNYAMRMDSLIVQDSIDAIHFSAELKYKSARNLNSKLMKNDTMRNDNGLFENYYDSLQTTAAGDLGNIEFAFTENAIMSLPIGILDSLISSKLDSLVLLDSMININSTATLIQQRQDIRAAINILKLQLSNIKTADTQTNDSIFSSLKMQNGNVVFTNDIEQMEKEINDFRLTYFHNSLSGVDTNRLNTIKYIAGLCPYAYGVAVFKARSELVKFGIDSSYDDISNCLQLGYYRQAMSAKNTQSDNYIVALPNPSNGNVTFYFQKQTNNDASLTIRDLIGNVIEIVPLTKNLSSCIYNGTNLTPAVYYVNYHDAQKVTHSVKLIIIR